MIEVSDVILEVLDARDPLGTRCVDMEKMVLRSGPDKHLVLLLNKIGTPFTLLLLSQCCFGYFNDFSASSYMLEWVRRYLHGFNLWDSVAFTHYTIACLHIILFSFSQWFAIVPTALMQVFWRFCVDGVHCFLREL